MAWGLLRPSPGAVPQRLTFWVLLLASLISSAQPSADGAAELRLSARQTLLLTNNCVQCHARPAIGVPQMGVAEDWYTRNKQGEEVLLANVVYGLRGMPPLGYCSACSEADFRALIRVMSGVSGGVSGAITKGASAP